MGTFLIVSIIGGVIALIIVSLTRANRTEEFEATPRSTVRTASEDGHTSGMAPARQMNVYAYSGGGRKCRCAFCDGENSLTATQCCICGQPLK